MSVKSAADFVMSRASVIYNTTKETRKLVEKYVGKKSSYENDSDFPHDYMNDKENWRNKILGSHQDPEEEDDDADNDQGKVEKEEIGENVDNTAAIVP